MRLKFDVFTWIVLAAVVLLVVAAVVTVNLTGGQSLGATAYMTEDSPEAPVFNAILAVQQGDLARARTEFTVAALAENEKRGYDPIANAASYYGNDPSSRRIRIVKVNPGSDSAAASVAGPGTETTPRSPADTAYVTIAEDNFSGGGLFGRTTYSNERVIRVAREEGRWKVDDPNLFY